MPDLLDLLSDVWADTPTEWVIVGDWGLCGLCGCKTAFNQGGSRTGAVCDDCAQIDSCAIRPHNPVVERRAGRWGIQIEQAAHCENCGWCVNAVTRSDDGDWIELTGDDVLDLCAQHAHPRHTSHWGVSHEIADHDDLLRKQAKRRAAYLRRTRR